MRPFPALGRPFDWSYTTNRFILAATPAIGTVVGVGALIRGETLWDSAWWGYFAAGAAFLAWAIAVELHPDRPWLAAVATVLAPTGLLWGTAALLASAAVLLSVRAVAGTTGRSLRVADLVLLGIVAGAAAPSDSAVAALFAGAVGLGVSVVWHERRRAHHVLATALFVIAAGVSLMLSDRLQVPSSDELIAVWIGTAVGLVSLAGPGPVFVPTDREGGSVLAVRVRMARVIALLAAVGVSLTVGPAAVAPVWAALVAVAVRPR